MQSIETRSAMPITPRLNVTAGPGLNLLNSQFKPMNILIIDDTSSPPCNKLLNWTDFISPNEGIQLFIITSKGSLTDKDKKECKEYIELDHPDRNGALEVQAMQFHSKYKIHAIYAKQEELILRAAALRQLFGCTTGLKKDAAIAYRDKIKMKEIAKKGGYPCPEFMRISQPSEIIEFSNNNSYPFVIKPSTGCASAGVTVIKSEQDVLDYLNKDFYGPVEEKEVDGDDSSAVNDNWRTYYSGDLIAENYIDSEMFHVNGFAQNGKIVCVWPFKYLNSNLGFTQGNSYGNILIPKTDIRYDMLVNTAQSLLSTLPTPDRLVFHIELFARPKSTESFDL